MEPDPSWATVWFTPEQVGVWNWERFDNAEYAALHAQGLVDLDPAGATASTSGCRTSWTKADSMSSSPTR
jgi:hypothetical protein